MAPEQGPPEGRLRRGLAQAADRARRGAEVRAELSIEEERGPIYAVISSRRPALTVFHMIELLETQGAYTLKAFMEDATRRSREDGSRRRRRAAAPCEGPAFGRRPEPAPRRRARSSSSTRRSDA